MNCIVTAGPTYEPLDQVRRLTNFSTGRLGSGLANYLTANVHRVILLQGSYAMVSEEQRAQEVIPFTTTADLRARLQTLVARSIHAVFHAAAVSDFAFGKVFRQGGTGEMVEVQAGKFATGGGPLLAELVPTAKILPELRGWFSAALLVGWKFEVDGSRASALEAGRKQVRECKTDGCVVNGAAYGDGFGLVTKEETCVHLNDRAELFEALLHHVSG